MTFCSIYYRFKSISCKTTAVAFCVSVVLADTSLIEVSELKSLSSSKEYLDTMFSYEEDIVLPSYAFGLLRDYQKNLYLILQSIHETPLMNLKIFVRYLLKSREPVTLPVMIAEPPIVKSPKLSQD